MTADNAFYCRRLEEELELASTAKTASQRQLHSRRADEYALCLHRDSPRNTSGAVTDWMGRRRSEAFGDWLADVM
jgi:hypothetical protein